MLSAKCHAQTYAEVQSSIEKSRLEAFSYQLLRKEIYSYTNSKDSTLSSYEIYDAKGNIVTARQYKYKSRKFYDEQFFEYDTLGRLIARISSNTYLDKINKTRISTHVKYEYRGDTLFKIISETYEDDKLIRTKDIPERKNESITYEKEEVDSLNRVVHYEYYSPAGLERFEIKYHENGQIQSVMCYVDDRLWFEGRYNVFGKVIEYKEWLYDSKSHKLVEHSITFYNVDQKVISIDHLNSKGRVKATDKYYYYRN